MSVIRPIQLRRGTAAEAASANPVLLEGEPAFVIDTGDLFVGDGETAIEDLTPVNGSGTGGGVPTSRTVNGHPLTADVTVTKSDIGLGSADNTADTAKPVSTAQQTALDLKANLTSPAFTGNPTAPTQTVGNASTRIATTDFVAQAVAALIASAPGALDTLDELAAAMGDDANFAATVTTALATKLAKASNLSDLTDAAAARTNLGLGNVNNTADSAKPVSTAQQTALDAKQDKSLTVNPQTGTTYTLQASDNGKLVTLSNAAAITVTVPAGLGAGFNCICQQIGVGQVSFVESGVTLHNRQSHSKIAGQWGFASIISHVANVLSLGGDTAE